MTKEITLTNGKVALIDDEDFEKLNEFNWYFRKEGYAVSNTKHLMHRLVMNAPKGYQVDHINLNKLDNRKSNLRLANASTNKANDGLRANNTSGYKGVQCMRGRKKPWMSRIKVNYKNIYLGYYYTPEEAARAYNEAAYIYFGEYARLNKIV